MYELTREELVLAIEGLRALQRNLTDSPRDIAAAIADAIGDELDETFAPADLVEKIDVLCVTLNFGPAPDSEVT